MNEHSRPLDEAGRRDQVRRIEQWYLDRGLPHFVVSDLGHRVVWARAAPFLGALSIVSASATVAVEPTGAVIGAAATALAAVFAVWVIGNLVRRQPPFERPRRLGALDIISWLTANNLPYLAGGIGAVGAGVGADLSMAAVAYLVTSYGIVPLTRWLGRRLVSSLSEVRTAAARTLPLLLLFVSFFFLTAETWQAFSHLEGTAYGLSLLLFVAVGVTFVWSSLRPDLDELEHFASWEAVRDAAAGTPAADVRLPTTGSPTPNRLTRRQRVNSLLVAVGSQTIMAVLVAAVLGVFFLLFGFLVVDLPLIEAWVPGRTPHVLLDLPIPGRRLALTEEHIRVSGFLATFSGFYFGVYSVTDPTFRQGLTDDSRDILRQAMATLAIYSEARRALADPAE